MGSMSIFHWLLVFVVISLFFGTDKLRHMGRDLGSAFRQFKEGLNEGGANDTSSDTTLHEEKKVTPKNVHQQDS